MDLSNVDRASMRNRLHLNASYAIKRKLITPAQVKELLMPVQRITGSRAFGDKLEDYQELCKQLGDFKLSRVKANELNIMARGGASVIQAHLNVAKKTTAAQAGQPGAESTAAPAEAVKKGKAAAASLSPPIPTASAADIESLVTSGSVPPVDLGLLADWLNENQHSIQSKNHLLSGKNFFNETHGTQLSEMKKIMTSDRYFLRGKNNQGASGRETGHDSYAYDQGSSRLGATARLFQSRASSRARETAEAHNRGARAAGREAGTSQMSDSLDDFHSQGGGLDNPYDQPTSLNLPKLIN